MLCGCSRTNFVTCLKLLVGSGRANNRDGVITSTALDNHIYDTTDRAEQSTKFKSGVVVLN